MGGWEGLLWWGIAYFREPAGVQKVGQTFWRFHAPEGAVPLLPSDRCPLFLLGTTDGRWVTLACAPPMSDSKGPRAGPGGLSVAADLQPGMGALGNL